jgi:hypothetical protein
MSKIVNKSNLLSDSNTDDNVKKETLQNNVKKEEKKEEKIDTKKEALQSKEMDTKKEEKYIFRLSTKEGYTFKVITELLKNRIKNCNFIIDKKGIFSKTSDSKNYNLIVLKLYAKNMKYICAQQVIAGLNMGHLQKNLKSLKKKDGLLLYIDSKSPNSIIINPIKPDFSGSTKNTLKIISLPIQDCEEPDGYNEDDEIPIFSKDFQKMIKEVGAINSKTINIQRRGKVLRFFTEFGDLYNAESFLGDDDGNYQENFNNLYENYNSNFQITDITQLSKVSGLSTIVNINANKNLPIRITMNLGSIGKIILYTKSKEIIESEEKEQEEQTDGFYVEEDKE